MSSGAITFGPLGDGLLSIAVGAAIIMTRSSTMAFLRKRWGDLLPERLYTLQNWVLILVGVVFVGSGLVDFASLIR